MNPIYFIIHCYTTIFSSVKSIPVVAILLFIASCSSSNGEIESDSLSEKSDSTSAVVDRSDKNSGCCFRKEEDFDPFFPDTCGSFYLHSVSATEIKCITDTLLHSFSERNYINARQHLIRVTIIDYCVRSYGMLDLDYGMLVERHRGHNAEFNEFDVPDSHFGFSEYDAANKSAIIVANVDNRFLVQISDQVCENTKNVLEIYGVLPLDKLALYDK